MAASLRRSREMGGKVSVNFRKLHVGARVFQRATDSCSDRDQIIAFDRNAVKNRHEES